MMNTVEFSMEIRKVSLAMVYDAKASHIGGALSMADILAVLYSKILRIDENDILNEERDRFLLSKGHACTSLYATLALRGFFPVDELKNYGKDGSKFICHASHKVPGVELSTGSLGHALSYGCGLALAAKRKHKTYNTYVLVSDGELDEGSNWEAILFAPQHKLDNLTLIVDYNKIQSLGDVKDVINLEPITNKFEAFNWYCIPIDGHNHQEIEHAFKSQSKGKPRVIIANTIKGKGVDFMENKLLWHYKSPSEEQYLNAIQQINSANL